MFYSISYSSSFVFSSKKFVSRTKANTSAHNPLADEAKPALVGKLLILYILTWNSSFAKLQKNFLIIWNPFGNLVSMTFFCSLRSSKESTSENEILVVVKICSQDKVSERDEFSGMLKLGSNFPQYLIKAILTGVLTSLN